MKIISLLIKHIKFYTSIFAYIRVNMAIEMLDNDCNFVVSKAKRCFQPNMVKHYDYNMEY